jgi:hypothetical protein
MVHHSKFAGVNIDDGKVDGIDICPVLYNEPGKKRECFFYYYTDSLEAVRFNNWKLLVAHLTRSKICGWSDKAPPLKRLSFSFSFIFLP